MKKVERKELLFRGKPVVRTIYRHVLGSNIVKIGGVWFKVRDNIVTEKYITYDKNLYIRSYPEAEDLIKLGTDPNKMP